MKRVVITRDPSADDGTFGELKTPGFECYTGELPYRDVDGNGISDQNFSCIGPAPDSKESVIYICRWGQSKTRKNLDGSPEWTFRIEGVKGRQGCLIHSGNFCGDIKKGFVSDVEGCIILGRAILDNIEIHPEKRKKFGVERKTQRGVSSSRDTVKAFVDHMGKDPFELEIRWKGA